MTHVIAFYINDTACRRLHADDCMQAICSSHHALCNVNPCNADLFDDAPSHIETYIAVLSQRAHSLRFARMSTYIRTCKYVVYSGNTRRMTSHGFKRRLPSC